MGVKVGVVIEVGGGWNWFGGVDLVGYGGRSKATVKSLENMILAISVRPLIPAARDKMP